MRGLPQNFILTFLGTCGEIDYGQLGVDVAVMIGDSRLHIFEYYLVVFTGSGSFIRLVHHWQALAWWHPTFVVRLLTLNPSMFDNIPQTRKRIRGAERGDNRTKRRRQAWHPFIFESFGCPADPLVGDTRLDPYTQRV